MAEKRLIDANRFEKLLQNHRSSYLHKEDVIAALAEQPTVDAAEVIRCEHCACNDRTDNDKRRGIVWCKKICRYMKVDGFCSEGKRRTQ